MRRQLLAAAGVLSSLLLAVPAIAQPAPAPELAPGGTVVLRGTPAHDTSAPMPPPGPSNPVSTGPAAPPALGRSDGWDAGGFDNRYDRSGLTPTPQ